MLFYIIKRMNNGTIIENINNNVREWYCKPPACIVILSSELLRQYDRIPLTGILSSHRQSRSSRSLRLPTRTTIDLLLEDRANISLIKMNNNQPTPEPLGPLPPPLIYFCEIWRPLKYFA